MREHKVPGADATSVISASSIAAPAICRMSETGMATPSAFATGSISRIIVVASHAVPGFSIFSTG
ncbi:MAG: hypothetical protein WBB16_01885 [Aestuariivirga sp.]